MNKILLLILSIFIPISCFAEDCTQYNNSNITQVCRDLNAQLSQTQQNFMNNFNSAVQKDQIDLQKSTTASQPGTASLAPAPQYQAPAVIQSNVQQPVVPQQVPQQPTQNRTRIHY